MFFSTFFLLFWTVFSWTARRKRGSAEAAHAPSAAVECRPYARIDRNYDSLDQVSSSSTLYCTCSTKWVNESQMLGNYVQVKEALQVAGLESSNLIIGVDFTKSNEWTGTCVLFSSGSPDQQLTCSPPRLTASILYRDYLN
jgi:hypothetical protein